MGINTTLLYQVASPLQEMLKVSNCSCEFLLTMVDDILDLSKLEMGQMRLEKDWYYLEDTVQQVLNILHYQVKLKHLLLDCQID